MARDLGRYGIRVAAIAPGVFETPLGHLIPEGVRKRLVADTPMGRMGQPEEFAHFVQSCIENSYINGVHLRIDGAIKMSHI
jgi:NAD(P)-dependent dehydrogenase (short-subunit alcohol dehydrogenase family)